MTRPGLTRRADLGSMKAMGMLSRAVRLSLVWAAALLTPIAGTPHVDCLCPNGHVKLFCLNLSLHPTACCCGGSCSGGGGSCSGCGTQAPDHQTPGKGKACCRHARLPGAPAGNRLAGTGCKKTLAEADSQTIPQASTAVDYPAAAVPLAPAFVPMLASAPAAGGGPLSWQSSWLPPPTDRVIAFQHLVI
jgi:hypothetical protein